MSKQILPENRTRTSGNSVSGIVRKLLAWFTAFSEADARVLLSGYGLHEFEVDQMQWDRPGSEVFSGNRKIHSSR